MRAFAGALAVRRWEFPPASMRSIPGYVTRIAPDRFSGIGPWAAKSGE
jgi:hypothetical protein